MNHAPWVRMTSHMEDVANVSHHGRGQPRRSSRPSRTSCTEPMQMAPAVVDRSLDLWVLRNESRNKEVTLAQAFAAKDLP